MKNTKHCYNLHEKKKNNNSNLNFDNVHFQLMNEQNKKIQIKENFYEERNKNKKYKNFINKENNRNTNIKFNYKNYNTNKKNITYNVNTITNENNYLNKDPYVLHQNYKKNEAFEKRECFNNDNNRKYQEMNSLKKELFDFNNALFCKHTNDESNTYNKKRYPDNTNRNNECSDSLENSLEDVFFDIHAKSENDKKQINSNVNINEHQNTTYEKLKGENYDKQLLLDHIKRLEYQNNIFLNNLLNMYYVCVDYIKMQDEKIKKKEEIIFFQNKIINNFKKKEKAGNTIIYSQLDNK